VEGGGGLGEEGRRGGKGRGGPYLELDVVQRPDELSPIVTVRLGLKLALKRGAI
jgi:hypothetical protein